MNNTNPNLKIAIAGAGSIGFFIGGLLHLSGNEVTFFARKRLIKQIKEHNLRVTDYAGLDETLPSQKLDMSQIPSCFHNADIIFVTVKSSDTIAMAELIDKHAQHSTLVISLQNGVTAAQDLKAALPNFNVLAGMVPFNVAQMGNGHFHRGTSGDIIIEKAGAKISRQLNSQHLIFNEHEDIQAVQWGKLLINLNNALNALSGIPLLEQLENRGWRLIMAKQMSEALKVLQKANISAHPPSPVPAKFIPFILRLPTFLFKRVAKQMLTIDPNARSSMWEDLQKGRKTEIDEFQGQILRLAEQHNMQVPTNQKVLEKIKEVEENQAGSPQLQPTDII